MLELSFHILIRLRSLIYEKEIGIADIYIYKIEGETEFSKISEYPLSSVVLNDKNIIKWHRMSNKCEQDILYFIEEELGINEFKKHMDLQGLQDNYLFSVIYDKDKIPPGEVGYSIYDWIELYFLDIEEKKIIHISYGKF